MYDNYGRYGEYEPHTGDPNADLKYEQMYKVPDVVKKFLIYFRNVINDGLIFEIQNLYENTWVPCQFYNFVSLSYTGHH